MSRVIVARKGTSPRCCQVALGFTVDVGGDPADHVTLAPSYDHGNSLGFNPQDDRRILELGRDPGLEKWASRGLADRFEASREITLVEFAHSALSMAAEETGVHWLGRLAHVSPAAWKAVTNGTHEMSEACRTFCVRLLMTNQRRLLDGV